MNCISAAVAVGSLTAALSAQVVTGTSTFAHPDGTTHHYEAVQVPGGISWEAANAAAASRGGHLVTITSAGENTAAFTAATSSSLWTTNGGRVDGPWLGSYQTAFLNEPAGDWEWIDLETVGAYANWSTNFPDNAGNADRMHFGGAARDGRWADAPASALRNGYVVEYGGPFVKRTVGLTADEPNSGAGYTLISAWQNKRTHLLDRRGRVVNTWVSNYNLGMANYMIGNGQMIRCGSTANPNFGRVGGNGGILEAFEWNGQRAWSFEYSTPKVCLHHDAQPLPNGNVLLISWEAKTIAEATAAGRNPAMNTENEVWPEKIIEIQPTGTTARIVWEWNVWDHLVQDFDPTKANYGVVANHPERIDINYGDPQADWLHANAVDYNEQLDQIMISIRAFNELWVIDHSTTTAEARTSTGGRSGKGGDILYRWGNPEAYDSGTPADRKLFLQHNTQWIRQGLPGAGNILIFNNGGGRPGGNESSVDEIVPPVDARGNYTKGAGAYGPTSTTWTYQSGPDFYSRFVGGAQRLPSGNTLVGAGWQGHSFEVDPQGNRLWSWNSPVLRTGVASQGDEVTFNVFFRSPRYTARQIGIPGGRLVPGQPLEFHDSVLLVEGSTLPYRAAIDEVVRFDIRARDERGKFYLVGTSATPGLIGFDKRFARIGADIILDASVTNSDPTVFRNYLGVLDSFGSARPRLAIPNDATLRGLDLFTTFVVLDPAARSGISFVSNTAEVQIR